MEGGFRGCSGLFRGGFGEVPNGQLQETNRKGRGKLVRKKRKKIGKMILNTVKIKIIIFPKKF